MKTQQLIGSFFRDVVSHLDQNGVNDLTEYLDKGKTQLVEHFLDEHDLTHFMRDNSGNTYLHLCMASHFPKKISPLLQKGLDVAAVNDQGNTPLHSGCGSYSLTNIELLLKNGADVNARNNDGETPLHVAIRHGRDSIMRFLIKMGADVEVKNYRGQTVLEVAISCEAYELAGELHARKAS